MRIGLGLTVAVVASLAGCGGSGSKRTQGESIQPQRRASAVAAMHWPGLVIRTLAGMRTASVAVDKGVDYAVADPHGGWFISGAFTRVDGVSAPTLARLWPSGAVDRGWLAVRGADLG